MRRFIPGLALGGGLTVLVLLFFGDVLFRDRQFAYRDAAHYYYPLYQRVQAEWNAGRWPLWEPEENSGMPLLGNPTAAVLYPGKILFAGIPYAWGARIYIIAHVILAFVAMVILMRHWKVSWTGSTLSGLGYAFGMPVLFQYCNVIYLVGAAWSPLGFHAADRWLRKGQRWGLVELAVVLAMQVLGGEPQSAYVIGICSAGYAFGLGRETRSKIRTTSKVSRKSVVLLTLGFFTLWMILVLAGAYYLPKFRERGLPKPVFPWVKYVPYVVLMTWSLFAIRLIWIWKSKGRSVRLRTMLLGLIAAGGMGGALTSAQLIPVFEYTSRTARAAEEGPHDIYPFSLEPSRLVEAIWPRFYGSNYGETTHWFFAIPPTLSHAKEWIPSLYLGGFTLILGLAGWSFKEAPSWRKWLCVVGVITFLGALGEYAGPLWWMRCIPMFNALIGPHDSFDGGVIRFDDQLRDGDGSFYWFLATTLPGFGQFRYPAKLLSFTALTLAALSGVGWDQLLVGRANRVIRLTHVVLGLTTICLVALVIGRSPLLRSLDSFAATGPRSSFGPLDSRNAWWAIFRSLIHGLIWMVAILTLVRIAPKRPKIACTLAIMIAATDLWIANKPFLVTVPQSLLDAKPKAVALIEDAEKLDPDTMPFRVHRMPSWEPMTWHNTSSINRLGDLVRWEHDTLQPKYGLMFGINYTFTMGVAELFDYDMFMASFFRHVDEPTARALSLKPGDEIVYHARRGYDLWNTRYFIVPAFPGGWKNELRGYASYLFNVDQIYPPKDAFTGPGGTERQRAWVEDEDMQIFRNRQVMPRSWIVHEAKFLNPIVGLARAPRKEPMEAMIYQDDPLWHDPSKTAYDPRRVVWIEAKSDERLELAPFLTGGPPNANESVRFLKYEPQRVEIQASMKRPGIVVLADVNFPGWKLAIDGKPAPIRVVNRIMRGAALPSGEHTLVYTYEPRSFYVGGMISLASIVVLLATSVGIWRRPISALLQS